MAFLPLLLAIAAVAGQCDQQSCLHVAADGTCAVCNLYLGCAKNPQGVCANSPTAHCTALSATNWCQTCIGGYAATGGFCLFTSGGRCRLNGPNPTCAVCYRTFYRDSRGQCAILAKTDAIANCLEYSQRGTCASCAKGYYLRANQCAPSPANCAAVGAQFACQQCEPNTFAAATSTDPLAGVDFWTLWYRFTNYGAVGGLGQGSCVANADSKCITASSATQCEKCAAGHYVNAQGVCTPTAAVPSCEFYASASQCASCLAGFFLENSQCKPNPSAYNAPSASSTPPKVSAAAATTRTSWRPTRRASR